MRTSIALSRRRGAAIILALATGLAGCADPYADVRGDPAQQRPAPTPTAAPATATPAPTAPQVARTPSPADRADEPGATAEALLRAFAERWSNWSWRSPAPHESLARMATGKLRDYLREQDLQPLNPGTLERTKPSWSGRIEAISFKADTGDRRPAVVVVREQEYRDGEPLPDGLSYTVYLAEVTRVDGGWAVSRWEGQP